MKRKFITNLALLILLNLLVKPFWIFGIDRTVQNVVGAEQYGFYFALFNFSLILNILLDIGITNFNNRNISQNQQLLSKHFSNILVLRMLLGLGYFVISMTLAWIWNYNWDQLKLLLFLVFNQFLLSMILYFRSNLAGLQLFKTDSIISVLDRFLMIIICGFLLWGHVTDTPFKIKWFVFAQTAAYGITATISFFLILLHTGKIQFRFERQFSLAILKKSYPYAILILLMGLYNRIDSVMLERMLPDGSRQAGIYAQAFRILDAASMFALLFANLLLPMFSRMLKHKEPIGSLVQLSFFLILVPSIIISITSIFFRHQVMELLYHCHVDDSASIFAILMIGFTGIATTYIFGTLLTANGSLKMLNIMAFFGMLINIGLNLVLIPKFQALGAAVSSLVTQSFTAFAQVIIAFFIFGFNFKIKKLILLFLFIGATVLIGIISSDLPYNWLVNMGIMVVLSTITAFSIGLIRIRNIYKIIRYEK